MSPSVTLLCVLLGVYSVDFSLQFPEPVLPSTEKFDPDASISVTFTMSPAGEAGLSATQNNVPIYEYPKVPVCPFVDDISTVFPEIKWTPMGQLCQMMKNANEDLSVNLSISTNINALASKMKESF